MTDRMKKRIPALFLAVFAIAAVLGLYAFSTATASSDTAAADDTAEASDQSDAAETEAQDDAKNEDEDGEDGEDKEKKAPIPVRATAVETGRVAAYISATANIVPESEVEVLSEWEGRLAELRVEEGDRIAANQVLALLADADVEILLNKAKLRSETSAQAFERAKKLRDQELLSPEEFDKVALDHELAAQELAEAEWRLEKTRIRAPFGGVVTERMAQPGQHVRPGDQLFRVADFHPLITRIYLPEKDVLALEKGREVRISLKAAEDIRFTGRIRQISPVVDTGTGTVKVTIEASDAPRQVRPGAFVRVDIVREARQAALLLPREAIVRELQKAYVFVAEDGVAAKRSVTLGLEEGANVEVTSGVTAGDRVIVAGQGGLKDGAAVKLIES